MSLKQMPLKTLKALIECHYTHLALCAVAYEQTSSTNPKQMFSLAGSLAQEQLDTLVAEFTERKGEDKANKLIATIHDKINDHSIIEDANGNT